MHIREAARIVFDVPALASGYRVVRRRQPGRLQARAKSNSDRMLAAADRVFGQPPKQRRKVTAGAPGYVTEGSTAGTTIGASRMAL